MGVTLFSAKEDFRFELSVWVEKAESLLCRFIGGGGGLILNPGIQI